MPLLENKTLLRPHQLDVPKVSDNNIVILFDTRVAIHYFILRRVLSELPGFELNVCSDKLKICNFPTKNV